jgi:hypothetical protein
MLDKRTEMMLQMASTMTAEDLDYVRGSPPGEERRDRRQHEGKDEASDAVAAAETTVAVAVAEPESVLSPGVATPAAPAVPLAPSVSDPSRGARERQRTRESKVSTTCVGQPRTPHPWWPIDTELEGRINGEVFTATVVENSQVKSGRSVLITSGAAQGRVCITPTRAAIEATEEYRRIANLGRGGGITNGWSFWKQKR